MMLQVAVRLEQRLGSQMQEPGEQPWQGEKKRLTKKQQQQQQQRAARSSPGQAAAARRRLLLSPAHTPVSAFHRAKNGKVSPKTRGNLPPPNRSR
ncbi:hypothetical protein WISP_93582 [Willisornis vidua]|uniref:Uncharacterized protein n=1 Tax=Willisornis vidua TaxID=1566151 RepID=A0ABQ9D1V4_9PASS|nr:hypothetical protein WISP_93582 [Willisornis vidua]